MMCLRWMLLGVVWAMPCVALAQGEMHPFVMDWRDNSTPLVDLSMFLDAPAGKAGAIGIKDAHLVTPDGRRFRIWGINIASMACFPSRGDAPVVAAHLARFGINCARFHFLDRFVFGWGGDNTRSLDPNQLDKFDYFIAELKKRGIYTNLNLNVGRTFREGDGVKDYEYLGFAKVVNYSDEHVQMLHKEYARQLLTHHNPYTGNEYRREPAVAIMELVNENSIVEAWFSNRLLGKNKQKNPGLVAWIDITASYAEQLTKQYNGWLRQTLQPEELDDLRRAAGVAEGEAIPRLSRGQFKDAPAQRFHAEAKFYMHLEREYFAGMYKYLKNDLGVMSLVVGTSDHNHYNSGYPLLSSASLCDILDGHVYWQYPRYVRDAETELGSISSQNTPMVNDPLHSTIVQLSRSAMAGKPYMVSEVDHPFPNEYAGEGIGILAAYAAFHDWDGIFFYPLEHRTPAEWGAQFHPFSGIQPDPVRMMNVAAGACMFLRGDVQPAKKTVYRSYSPEQVRESIRLDWSQWPFFTPGFNPALALMHATRIRDFEKSGGPYPGVNSTDAIVSDTGELVWHRTEVRSVSIVPPARRIN